jgi:hypothetical protein
MEYQFTNGNGQRFRATLSIADTKRAAEVLSNRALKTGTLRPGEMRTVKALEGSITLKLEAL